MSTMQLNTPENIHRDCTYSNTVTRNISETLPICLSHAEKNFIKILDNVIQNKAFIFIKVSVNDVLSKVDKSESVDKYTYANKHFDFVLCDKNDLTIKCVIELDDRSNALQNACPEYSYKSLCKDISIPLVEIKAMCGYDVGELKRRLYRFF